MEGEAVRRRLNMIAAHFAPNDDSLSATHLLPLNCSSGLNSVIRRRDNRMNFARQGSADQACFMRQTSSEQLCQGSAAQSGVKCSGTAMDNYCSTSEVSLFSRPVRMEQNFSGVAAVRPLGQDCQLSMPDLPKFARPNTSIKRGEKQFHSEKKKYSSESNGIEWSPRMDVTEYGRGYVMTVEIPGVSISDIRVEVDDQNLTVTGQRSTRCRKVAGLCNNLISAYHKQEILQGPYQVVWPLPTNVNKDSVSAEFLDGFLRIIIPKL